MNRQGMAVAESQWQPASLRLTMPIAIIRHIAICYEVVSCNTWVEYGSIRKTGQ
jgi:hypothetical protein